MSAGTLRIRALTVITSILLNAILVFSAHAQAGKGTIIGHVTDSSDAVLQGAKITVGGISGPFSDAYLYSHFQLDVQGSSRLRYGFTLVAYGLNLTGEVFGFYNGQQQYLIQREYYGPTLALGMRWSPGHEK